MSGNDDDTQSDLDYAGVSPLVRLLHQVFAQPVARLGDVAPQLLAGVRTKQAAPAADSGTPDLPAGVDWGFVAGREGDGTQAEVPADSNKIPFANSGVTVAHGFDLGQRNAADLERLGLDSDVVTALTPYLGLRGQAAQDYLVLHPLSITPQQQDQIDRPVFVSGYDRLAKSYNAATTTGTRFQDLPQDAQTAIMDVAHQYGNLAMRTPNFWNQIVNGQWQDAQNNLMNFGDAHPTRRRLEGGLMQNAIASGSLSCGRVQGTGPGR